MAWLVHLLRSSIGKKYVVGAMGFLLCLYLMVHLFGNLMVYGGQEWFNTYAETLESLPGLILIELGLAAIFLIHILFALWVTWGNWRSAGTVAGRYAVMATKGEKDVANTTMIYSGALTIAFLILHVLNVRFDAALIGGGEPRYGLYGTLVFLFKHAWYSAFYIVCMIVLGAHLWHGVQSVPRTFGFQHPKYFPLILKFSKIFAVVMALGFSSIPLYVMFGLPEWEEYQKELKLAEEYSPLREQLEPGVEDETKPGDPQFRLLNENAQ